MARTFHFAVSLLAVPFFASAQQALTGTITGSITDASEAAISGAQVAARNTDTGLERTTMSGGGGLYTLTLLPVGEYEVTAKKQGFADVKVGPVRVGVGQAITVELRMAVGTARLRKLKLPPVWPPSRQRAPVWPLPLTTARSQTSASTVGIF